MTQKTSENYPTPTPPYTDEYVSRWWALLQGLELLWKHAESKDIELDDVPLDTRKIVREYVNPISGDILHHMKLSRKLEAKGLEYNTETALI